MTNETELRDRVHEILYSHRAIASGPGDCVCACNTERVGAWMLDADYRAHVAQAIIDEFGMTVETVEGVMDPDGDYDAQRIVGKWEKQ